MSTTRPSALAAGILSMLLVATIAAPTVAADPAVDSAGSSASATDPSPAVEGASEPAAEPAAQPQPKAAEPEPKYRFTGYGTDHGVGLSQRGAAGRAEAGQAYDQILQHYFYRVQLDTVPEDTTIRALVVKSYDAGTGKTALVQGGNLKVKVDGEYVNQKSKWTFDTPGVDGREFPQAWKLMLVGRGASGAWHLEVQDSSGETQLSVTDTDARLTVRSIPAETFPGRLRLSIRPTTKYDTYEGVLRIGRVDGHIRVVNIVPIEPFVRSVAPQELGPSNLQETLKSQAVVARSYFLAGLGTGTGFLSSDVEAYRDSQSYKGSKGEKTAVTTAVDATAYQVLKYKKSDGNWYIARTFYHAVGGGATEASQNVFTGEKGTPGSKTPYLKGGPDVDEDGVPYDATASAYAWRTRSLTLDQLSAILAKDSRTNVGKLTSWPIESEPSFRSTRAAALLADADDDTPSPNNRGVSGRLTWVVLKGVKNGKTVKKQVAGWLFKSVFNKYRGSGDPIGSTMIFRTKVD